MIEYDRTSPIGDIRRDWQAASICATFANMLLASHGSNKRFRVRDFLLEFGSDKKVEDAREGKTWQQMKQIAMMLTAESKGRFSKKQR